MGKGCRPFLNPCMRAYYADAAGNFEDVIASTIRIFRYDRDELAGANLGSLAASYTTSTISISARKRTPPDATPGTTQK